MHLSEFVPLFFAQKDGHTTEKERPGWRALASPLFGINTPWCLQYHFPPPLRQVEAATATSRTHASPEVSRALQKADLPSDGV